MMKSPQEEPAWCDTRRLGTRRWIASVTWGAVEGLILAGVFVLAAYAASVIAPLLQRWWQ